MAEPTSEAKTARAGPCAGELEPRLAALAEQYAQLSAVAHPAAEQDASAQYLLLEELHSDESQPTRQPLPIQRIVRIGLLHKEILQRGNRPGP